MAFRKKDRVWEVSTTSGQGALTLSGAAAANLRTFASVLSTGDTCYGFAAERGGSGWEVNTFTMQANGTLTRGTPFASSNGGALVSFSGLTLDVVLDAPADDTASLANSNVFVSAQGVATGAGNLDGLVVAKQLSFAGITALGYDNVRLGINSAHDPAVVFENSQTATLWAVTGSTGGDLIFTSSTTGVAGYFDANGVFRVVFNAGIGPGAVAASGLMVWAPVAFTNRGVSNIRLGLDASFGEPYLIWEHSGGQSWGIYNFGGAFKFVNPDVNTIYAQFDTDGDYSLGGSPNVAPAASACFDLQSTARGFLPPRLTTTQRDAISSPATGLVLYNTSLNKLQVWTGAAWETVTSA